MPRPDLTARRTGVKIAPKSSNPLINWLATRKERRQQAEEQASRMITNKIAENESTIIDQLNSIDFLHSKLPKEVLERKSRPEQRYGDLEYAAQGVIHMLLKNPQTIKMDIRKIDEKLLTLVLLFKQAVEQGDVRAAYAAKGALIRGINDIRSRIPQNQPELAKQFVEANTKYLDQWITLVGIAQVADRTKQNVEEQRKRHDAAIAKDQEANAELLSRLQNDNEYTIAFNEIVNHDAPEERSKWTEIQREVHKQMIERRMAGANLALNGRMLQQQEIDLSAKVNQLDLLYSKVATLPIVADPDLMNKFQEQIDELFEQLAASDAEIDETLKTMDDIEGRIHQLDNAPGAIRAREVAAEEAEKALEELKKLQEQATGKNEARARGMRETLGIKSEEELALLRKQAEEEQQRLAQEMYEQMVEADQESEQELLFV